MRHLSASVKVKVIASGIVGAIIAIALFLAIYGGYSLTYGNSISGIVISILAFATLVIGFLELIGLLKNETDTSALSDINYIRFILSEYHNDTINDKKALKMIDDVLTKNSN